MTVSYLMQCLILPLPRLTASPSGDVSGKRAAISVRNCCRPCSTKFRYSSTNFESFTAVSIAWETDCIFKKALLTCSSDSLTIGLVAIFKSFEALASSTASNARFIPDFASLI